MNRLIWLDAVKGVGIISVVMGHVLGLRYVYAFHMPLFFLISGYTFHLREDGFQYMKKLFFRLMVPYISFLVIINLTTYMLYDMRLGFSSLIWGGGRLKGIFAVYWFVTVLYGALLMFNLMIKQKLIRLRWCLLCLLAIAYLLEFFKLEMPWCIQVIPMAMVFMTFGYIYKIKQKSLPNNYIIIIPIMIAIVLPFFSQELIIDMKYTNYGIPIFSLITSTLIVYGLVLVSMKYEKSFHPLAFIGKASILIMYLHMFIYYILQHIGCSISTCLIFLCSILVPTGLYYWVRKNKIISFVLIGE